METKEPRIEVVEDFAPVGLVNAAIAEWPTPNWRHWHTYHDENSIKRASKDASKLPRSVMLLIEKMASLDMGDSFPDLELHGAGMHEIPDGGHLSRHLDGAIHPQTGWSRITNAILFLNHDFSGGELCFNGQSIKPKKNRLAIFHTSEDAWHWVNRVHGGDRKTISLFWWSQKEASSNRTCAKFTNKWQ